MARSLDELEFAFRAEYPQAGAMEKAEAEVLKEMEAIEKAKANKEIKRIRELKRIEKAKDAKATKIVKEFKKAETTKTSSPFATAVFYTILVIMLIGVALFSIRPLGNEMFGGIRLYKVANTSMEGVYQKGSLIIAKNDGINALVLGDDIAFTLDDGGVIVRRIVEIKENFEASGLRAFATEGIIETEDIIADEEEITVDEMILGNRVLGKVICSIPILGTILSWIGTNIWVVGGILLLLVIVLLFIKKKQKVATAIICLLVMLGSIGANDVRADELAVAPTVAVAPTLAPATPASTLESRPTLSGISEGELGAEVDGISELEDSLGKSGLITSVNIRTVLLVIIIAMAGTKGAFVAMKIREAKRD